LENIKKEIFKSKRWKNDRWRICDDLKFWFKYNNKWEKNVILSQVDKTSNSFGNSFTELDSINHEGENNVHHQETRLKYGVIIRQYLIFIFQRDYICNGMFNWTIVYHKLITKDVNSNAGASRTPFHNTSS
jgi:hypothetical protein